MPHIIFLSKLSCVCVQESHLKEIGVTMVGERILFIEYLKLLKKHKRDADRSRSLWTATTPHLGMAYHRNCGEFCFHVSTLVLYKQRVCMH